MLSFLDRGRRALVSATQTDWAAKWNDPINSTPSQKTLALLSEYAEGSILHARRRYTEQVKRALENCNDQMSVSDILSTVTKQLTFEASIDSLGDLCAIMAVVKNKTGVDYSSIKSNAFDRPSFNGC